MFACEPPSKPDDAIEAASGGGLEGAVVSAMADASSASSTATFGAEGSATGFVLGLAARTRPEELDYHGIDVSVIVGRVRIRIIVSWPQL
jgi:hypothetical protein